jgi:hypothetical protein
VDEAITWRGGAGAAVGFLLGLVQYWIARTFVERSLDAADAEEPLIDDRQRAEKLASVRRMLLASTVVIFTVVGFIIGRRYGAP